MGWKEFQEKYSTEDLVKRLESMDESGSGSIWYDALVDVHRWFAEAVAARDYALVSKILDLMDRLELT